MIVWAKHNLIDKSLPYRMSYFIACCVVQVEFMLAAYIWVYSHAAGTTLSYCSVICHEFSPGVDFANMD